MTGTALSGTVTVPVAGVLMMLGAVVSRRTVAFGVRIPYPERITPPVIRRQRLLYLRRTALVCACATVIVLAAWGHGSWWLSRIVLAAEAAADLLCLWLARRRIIAVKDSEDWYAGLRQEVVTDTAWRANPPRFPVAWVLPAVAVLAATLITGILRYPHLPARLPGIGSGGTGPLVPKSPVVVYAVVIGQAYVIALWTCNLRLLYRARPEIEARDPAGSAARYRALLDAFAKAILTLIALLNVALLLVALRQWQLWRPPAGLAVVPFLLGVAVFVVMLWRASRSWQSRDGGIAEGGARVADRDDDRFWKLGLVYVNSDDPAVVVAARFGIGWTPNWANPRAWLIIAGILAVPAGLAAILLAAGA